MKLPAADHAQERATHNRPPFLHWSFGGMPYSSPVEAGTTDFQLWIDPPLVKKRPDFRQEVMRACDLIDNRRGHRTVALCYSGGLDSETIARALIERGIPFEAYFLDIWGINKKPFEKHKETMASLGIQPHVVFLDKLHFYDEVAPSLFREFGIDSPTYLALAYLFSKIPDDRFIVTGDGDLTRSGPLFEKIAAASPSTGKRGIPTAPASVFYYLWSRKYKREGEFAFFSSTPELLAAMANHPKFEWNYPFSSAREALHESFPELARRPKTTNWDDSAFCENTWIRQWLADFARKWPEFDFWRSDTGAFLDLEKLSEGGAD